MSVQQRWEGTTQGARMFLGDAVLQFKKIKLDVVAATTEQDTGYDLPSTCVVQDVYLRVDTAESTGGTKTLDVGLDSGESGGDADGFLDGVSAATAGVVQGALASGGQTLGTLLHTDESGAGVLTREPFLTDSVTAKSVTYTLGSDDWVEFVGYLFIAFYDLSDI